MIVCDCWKIPSLQRQANSRPSDATRSKPGAAQRLVKVKIKSAIACVTQHFVMCPDEPQKGTFQPVAILPYLLMAVTIKVAQGKGPIVMPASETHNRCLISKHPSTSCHNCSRSRTMLKSFPWLVALMALIPMSFPFLLMTSAWYW